VGEWEEGWGRVSEEEMEGKVNGREDRSCRRVAVCIQWSTAEAER
jgi:hypothetical protein